MAFFRSKSKQWPQKPQPKTPELNGPPLSVIVICYQMPAQINQTLRTLLPPYQQEVDTHQYEVVVVDNGSAQPLRTPEWSLADNVRYVHVPKSQASVNPGIAVNWAVAGSRSPMICIMIDGACMLSPRVLRWGMDLAMLSQNTLVEVRGWDLAESMDEIEWPDHPYQLFEIARPTPGAKRGFMGMAADCNCLFMSRSLFDRIGGYDERYRHPGGALCNVDLFYRAVKASKRVFTVLGEGTFHQPHNGANEILNGVNKNRTLLQWKKEYEKLSRPLRLPPVVYEPVLAGHVPVECRRWLRT